MVSMGDVSGFLSTSHSREGILEDFFLETPRYSRTLCAQCYEFCENGHILDWREKLKISNATLTRQELR
jgi:hypothetical protein